MFQSVNASAATFDMADAFQYFGYAAFPFAISPGRRFDTVPRTRAESSATVLDLQKLT